MERGRYGVASPLKNFSSCTPVKQTAISHLKKSFFQNSRTFINSNINSNILPFSSDFSHHHLTQKIYHMLYPKMPFKILKFKIVIPCRSPTTIKKWPLTSQRNVHSISSQTNDCVVIKTDSSAQTNDHVEDDIIFISLLQYLLHTENLSPHLPILKLNINNSLQNFLLDSGASISLLSKSFFNNVKDNINYKRIATAVKITTVNSAVFCACCITLSFKIGNKFFKHSFYLINIPDESKFVGILGFDFLKSNKVVIDLQQNHITINDCKAEIWDTIPEHQMQDLQNVHLNTINHCFIIIILLHLLLQLTFFKIVHKIRPHLFLLTLNVYQRKSS